MRGCLQGLRRITGVEWACLIGGLLLLLHYAWLLDDSFVYFRYADNAALLGYGLVNNRGEYVEGFTSPLWMLMLLGVRPSASTSGWRSRRSACSPSPPSGPWWWR